MKKPTFKEKQQTVFKRTKQLREKATSSELAFMERLTSARINFIFQKGFINGNNYCIVDFYLPKPFKTVIEIDGGYHIDPVQVWKDKTRDRYLTEDRGFKVVRILNEDVLKFDLSLLHG